MTRKKTKEERQAEKLQVASVVVNFFDSTYGRNETRLDMWQQLCRDVGVEVGTSIANCKKVVRIGSWLTVQLLTCLQNLQGIYLNIVDYVKAKEGGRAFRRFSSPRELSNYIKNNKSKMFPREEAKRNPILRWMLIRL